ncbi:MAG TPA: hypothetical protein VE196_03710 [Pseudonocardiaceae bacterium]|nr:hypothetical protein [Pseudonocardiaceae bacterium]
MSTSIDAYQLSTLLRLSSELDIIGDVTATVTNPSDLLAWAHALPDPTICAWRAEDSGNRYVQVTAACHRTPIHGRITAVLTGDDHRLFWAVLLPEDLAAGEEQLLPLSALVTAWSATAPAPSVENTPHPGAPPETDSP